MFHHQHALSLVAAAWALTLVTLFLSGCTIPELKRRTEVDPSGEPISFYLRGAYAWAEQIGFFCMAIAMVIIGWSVGGVTEWFAGLAALATLGAWVSDSFYYFGWWEKVHRKMHLTCAFLAFFLGLCMESSISIHYWNWILGGLTIFYPVSIFGIWLKWRKHTAWQEKLAVADVCAFMISFTVMSIISVIPLGVATI